MASARSPRARVHHAFNARVALVATLAIPVVSACGGGAAPQEARSATAAPAAEFAALTADAERSFPSGAKLTVPSGWWVKSIESGLAFQDPEQELTITFLEVTAPSTEAAMASAFAKLARKPPPKELRTVHDTDVAGWDEVHEIVWETPPSEGSVVAMNVRRRADKAWVALLEGKAPAFSRRGTQVAEIVLGLKVPGVVEEDLSAKSGVALDAERLATFDAFLASALDKTRTPGMAVAVVQGGKIVFEKGYGVRERGKTESVTERTRFMIGSVTKSLSTLLIASLVTDGKIGWDTPLTTLQPSFKTGDPELTKKLTVAHTFCACTGMPRRDLDLIFEYGARKPEAALTAFDDLKPTTALGETFQYSNQMTALGGFLAARVAQPGKPVGVAYAAAMKARVFAPMGMDDTTASFDEGRSAAAVKSPAGVASPHGASFLGARDEPMVLPMAMESFVVPVAPAGAIFSTAHDMARYALVELAKGKTPEGKQIFAEAPLLERRGARVKVGPKGAYGLGLASAKLRGLPVLTHDGGTFGFVARFMVLPEHDLGLVVLSNSTGSGSMLADAATQRLIELAFDGKQRAQRDLDKDLEQHTLEWQREHDRVQSEVPEALAKKLTGTWRHPSIGAFTFSTPKGDRLRVDVGEWSSRIGYEKAEDGTERLFFVDPPIGGLPMMVAEGALVLQLGQESYRLEKK